MRPLREKGNGGWKPVVTNVGLIVLLLLSAVGMAAAQETTSGSIQGRLVDPQGLAIPGATVTVTSGQGSKSFTTDSEGRYFAPFLTPGTYTVRAELQGFKPVEQRNVDVRLGQRLELNLTMTVGGVTETVDVTGSSPVIDTSSTTIGANLDSELLNRVPVQRRFSDTLYLAPGVSSSGTAGAANPSVSGASGLENQYIIDGVNITDPGYGALGSYSIVFGSLGSATPFDFIKEVQVQTGGYAAEYGQATGGVVNVITKSGSNNFRGSGFAYFQPEQLEGTYETVFSSSRPEAVNVTGSRLSDAGLEIGGPIVRDRLFFFGAVDPQWDRRWYVAPQDFPLRSLGEVSRDRRIVPYSAKGTFQATPAHRFDLSVFGDPSRGLAGIQRRTALLRTENTGESSLKVRRRQPDPALRRLDRVAVAARSLRGARGEHHARNAGHQPVVDAELRNARAHRRRRLLRGEQRAEPAVSGEVDQPGELRRPAPDPLRLPPRAGELRPGGQLQRADLHAADR